MWQEKDKALYKAFKFKDFKEAFEFMTAVGEVAEQNNHHPKWQNEYNKVEIWLSTHDKNAITKKDRDMAKAIDQLYNGSNEKKSKMTQAKLFTDGGSRGNPGKSAIAYVICDENDNIIEKAGDYIGVATNNQAEYQAVLAGINRLKELDVKTVEVYMDSELVVKQINGQYKVKNNDLLPWHSKIIALIEQFKDIKFIHVPRAVNHEADAEVNRILDAQ